MGFDGYIEDLVVYNDIRDVQAIEEMLYTATAKASELLSEAKPVDALACLRDLDFLISSLVAHGVNPFESNRGVEAVLLELGEIAHTVPRGTSFTYASGNPSGRRRRTFTGDAQEDIFINAIGNSGAAISRSLEVSSHQEILTDMAPLIESIEAVTSAMISVKRSVTPEFFTGRLRSYLELYSVGGEDYLGPGGIQTLLPVDLIVWGVDSTDEEWLKFVEVNYPYLDAIQKKHLNLILEKNHGESLYTRALASPDAELQKGVYRCLRALKKFRYPHRKLVEDNVKIADDNSYDDSIVGVILRKTDTLLRDLEDTGNII
ncbi:MAG TPA: monodechloroaminopyrrolnitrin synthase PrnB family protein [Dongiaceae bacterium]|nr:monodechloroaminopyrrolnitrin synthase PrnB family protein [Dongiaceae bacterium]